MKIFSSTKFILLNSFFTRTEMAPTLWDLIWILPIPELWRRMWSKIPILKSMLESSVLLVWCGDARILLAEFHWKVAPGPGFDWWLLQLLRLSLPPLFWLFPQKRPSFMLKLCVLFVPYLGYSTGERVFTGIRWVCIFPWPEVWLYCFVPYMDFLLVIWYFPRLGMCCMVCWSVAWFHCLLRGLGLEGWPLVHLVYLVGWDFHLGFSWCDSWCAGTWDAYVIRGACWMLLYCLCAVRV